MSFLSDWKARLTQSVQALADPNFLSGLQFWTPGQPIWSDKNYASFVRSGYKKNPTVYACINKITGAAAGINWKLYTDRDMKKTIDKHPLLDLWRKPNPSMPGTGSFIEQCFGFWHMAGNNYIYAYRPTPTSPPLALWVLRPDRMKAVAGSQGVEGYVYGYQSNNPQTYDASQILHMKFPGYDDDVYGLSPIEVASYMADQQNEMLGWNTSLMQNAGRPASVFMSKNVLLPEQRNQIEQEIRKKYSGKRNAGRPLVLEADMTWQNMSLTPAELDFLKSFELGTRGIAAIFDIAPELIGDSAGKTFANVAEARQALYIENVLPKLDRKADYLNSWFVPMYPDLASSGAYFHYDKDDIEALQPLYAAQKKSIHDMARADWMAGGITLAEYCKLIGANKPVYGAVRRFGAVLVTEESLEDYADQSLAEPAAPPMPVPETAQGLPPPLTPPGLPAPKQPQGTLPPTTKPLQALPGPKAPKTPTTPKKPQKSIVDANLEYKDWQSPDTDAQLAKYYADGVTHLRWFASKDACDVCLQNDTVMVDVGTAFPSGAYVVPQHPNCLCSIQTYSVPEFGKSAMFDLLAQKIATYLAQGGYRVHEQNTEHPVYTVDTEHVDIPAQERTGAVHVRPLPVSTEEGDEGQDHRIPSSNEQQRQLIIPTNGKAIMTSGDAYRAFIERYS